MKINIKEAVKQEVVFSYYKDGNLWYIADDGENKHEFPVPIVDIGTATFKNKDKGILFMRYMRKWNELSNEEQNFDKA